MTDISTFTLEIIRNDRLSQFSNDSKEGDAFQQLCADLLKADLGERLQEWTPYPTKGRDGAVDISGEDKEGNTLICECKKNTTFKNAKSALDKLKNTLSDNLAKPGAANDSLYSPWFKPGFKRYIYCVSFNFGTKKERDEFKDAVKGMIQSLGDNIAGLAHLVDEDFRVTVYGWNELKPILEDSRYLYHKWIACDLGLGIEYLIEPEKRTDIYFSDYLYDNRLPYASRDEFKINHPGSKNLVGETEILDRLFALSGEYGCIIYGEGGVGKTRLMLELGFLAKEKGWIVFRITSELKDLERLKPWLAPGQSYLLIFDYIEENPLFGPGIFDSLRQISIDAEVRVIGNCRNTHMERADLKDADVFLGINLDLNKELESKYKEYVIEKILGDTGRYLPEDTDFHQLRPAFAVFMRFHHEKFKDRESVEEIKNFKSFRQWVRRRMALTFNKDRFDKLHDEEEIFYLFSILPSHSPVTESLYQKYGKPDYISPLLKDGWFEESVYREGDKEKKRLRVIHDTIADEMLVFRLEKKERLLDTEIRRIFEFAFENDSFYSCYRAFDRVSGWKGFENKEHIFIELFTGFIRERPRLLGSSDKFVITALLNENEKLKLIMDNLEFFREHIEEQRFGFELSYMMNCFSKLEDSHRIKEDIKVVFDIWISKNKNFLFYKKLGLRIVSTFLLLYGLDEDFIGEKDALKHYVVGCLKKYPLEVETSFVLKSWLYTGGDKELVAPYLEPWLKKYPLEMKTSFVFKSWLDAGGDKELVVTYLEPWLKKYPLEMETSFVLKSWLHAGGDKELVAHYLESWLQEYPLEMETSFVLQSWLDAGGDKELVVTYLEPWLQEYPLEMETSFVLKSWLDAGGDKELVTPYLEPWLQEYPLEMETRFVLKSWLYAGGDKELVAHYLESWLQECPLEMETSFVLQSWLHAGGDKELVVPYLEPWLKKYQLEMEMSFVLNSWLNAGGDKEIVAHYLEPWLEKYPLEMETSFVLKSWLYAGGDKELVAHYLEPWLKEYPLEMKTSFVLQSWLDAGGEKKIVKEYIKPWLEAFPLNEEQTSFVIRAWLDAGGEPDKVTPFVHQWLDKLQGSFEASYVIKSWVKRTNEAETIKTYAHRWLENYKEHKDADFVIKRFCRYEDTPDDVLENAICWCKKYIHNNEVLFTLSYLSRSHIRNKNFADHWLLEIISTWISRERLSNYDIRNLENIMLSLTKNKEFSNSEECMELTKKWFLSNHAFKPFTLHSRFEYLQQWQYFFKYSVMFTGSRIDFSTDEEKIKRFLYWVNGWTAGNKKKIKRNINYLRKNLPQYDYLWDIVQFDAV